ncbi:hypothetical protein KCU72_g1, partial [Aureobasidium melanogenum]
MCVPVLWRPYIVLQILRVITRCNIESCDRIWFRSTSDSSCDISCLRANCLSESTETMSFGTGQLVLLVLV